MIRRTIINIKKTKGGIKYLGILMVKYSVSTTRIISSNLIYASLFRPEVLIGDYKQDKQGQPCFGKVIVINL
jgi:hypothetical protein